MAKKSSKRMQLALKDLDRTKEYAFFDAIETLKKSSNTLKFDPSIEIAIKIGINLQAIGTNIRGIVSLPAGTGQAVKVAVISQNEDKIKEAKEAGADFVGGNTLIDTIKSGEIHFKICIATPDMMASIAPIARILGPKGLMPNPKLGTVTLDVANAVKKFKAGTIEFKTNKEGFINAKAGKISFSTEDIVKNVRSIFSSIEKNKPEHAKAKGTLFSHAYISYTMGPSVKLNKECFENLH